MTEQHSKDLLEIAEDLAKAENVNLETALILLQAVGTKAILEELQEMKAELKNVIHQLNRIK